MSRLVTANRLHTWALVACSAGLLLPQMASADSSAQRRADALFGEGKAHMAAGDLEHACPALAESFRLDPATGSLLALASCHEKQHKNLSALAEYREVVQRAQREGRPDRVSAAHMKTLALEAKIPSVRVDAPPRMELEGLVVTLNGVRLRPDQLGQAIPIDGDHAEIVATAGQGPSWRLSFPVAEERQEFALTLPADLRAPAPASVAPVRTGRAARATEDEDAELAEAPEEAPASAPPKPRKPRDPRRMGRITGLVLTGAGAAGLITSLGFTLRAAKLNHKSDPNCDGNLCTAEGKQQRLDARSAGSIATATGIAGATLAAGGLITYFVLRKSREDRGVERRISASPYIQPGGAGAAVMGSF